MLRLVYQTEAKAFGVAMTAMDKMLSAKDMLSSINPIKLSFNCWFIRPYYESSQSVQSGRSEKR